MLSLFRVPPMHRQRFVTEADIQAAATLGEEAGLVEPEEGVMLDHVIEMGEQTAREIMVPRVQIEAIDTEASLDEALEKAHESGFSRLPVFREDLDNIVGIAHVKDLLAALINGRDWHEYLREAWVVAEATPVPGIFDTMRTERSHMAVVADEYGGTAGIVTIEDVLEEVVGELRDEHERPEEDFVPLAPNEWMVSGRFRLDELYERIGLEMPEDEEADTIAGLLAEITGRIPAAGEEIEHEGLRYLVEESDGQYLAKVRVTASARPKTGGEQ
jgi:CBS domain containing-hemolysin-like protein